MEPDSCTPCPCGRLRQPGPAPRPGGANEASGSTGAKTSAHALAAYADCCGRWHAGDTHLRAPDAESLMRSRYSAFVLGLRDYLLATWHPTTRPASLQLEGPELRWLGLKVKQHCQQDEDHATVAFAARSKQGGRAHRLEENSRFVREHEAAGPRWYYLDGVDEGQARTPEAEHRGPRG